MLYDSDQFLKLFREGHSPSRPNLQYETHLTYMDDPKSLADRNVNLKVSDFVNKWRKSNLGI